MPPFVTVPGRPLRLTVPQRTARLVAALLAIALLASCAALPEFPEHGSGQWRLKPEIGPQADLPPQVPHALGPPGGAPELPPRGPGGCSDPDPAVVATCLAPVSAIAVLPGGQSALVAERTTGRIVRVERGVPPVEIATLAVEATGDGGLTGLALSPSYAEDELIFAYVTTPTGNEVVRLAPGDPPKRVLTGIPRGASGNAGALSLDGSGALLIATGNGGNPAAGPDSNSLGGKVLRVDTSGAPASTNPDPGSRVVASGLRAPRGLCTDPTTGTSWVTDTTADGDILRRVIPGQPLGAPAWTWRDRPGAAGCAVVQGRVEVALTDRAVMFMLGLGPDEQFVGEPRTIPLEHYGRVSAATLDPENPVVWLGTVNTEGGAPIPSDERVFQLFEVGGSGDRD
ncbi:MAG: PQQ-dependent sugar dehydrogenase [Actinomycetota bacterium]|nr:PQQ-dependent sugar dehydrogenase [Actinomycetota bacterium]